MTITTYQTLQVAVSNGITAAKMASRVTELIELFESEIRTDLRVRQMESRSTASTVGAQATLALPTDYLEMRNLRINTDPVRQLQFLPPNTLDIWHAGASTGIPDSYKIVGSEIIFGPTPAGVHEVEIDYYSFTALSDAAPTNWLLTSYPSAYLYGALAQMGALGAPLGALQSIVGWTSKYESILDKLRLADRGARWNGAPLIARPDFVTP